MTSPSLRALGELRIVVLHHHARHHLRRHVLAIGVVLAVDAVGVQIVLRQEDEPPAHAAAESRAGSRPSPPEPNSTANSSKCFVSSRSCDFSRSADVARDRRCRHHLGAAEIALRVARAHASFEIAIGGRDADLARLQQSRAQPDARPASRRQRMRARVEQRLPDAALLRLVLHRAAGRGEIELHARRDFLAAQDLRRRLQIFQPRIHAGDEIGLLDRDFLLRDLGDRLHHLHRVRAGDVRRDLGEIQHDASRVNRVRIGRRRIRPPLGKLLFRNARDAAAPAARDCALRDTPA